MVQTPIHRRSILKILVIGSGAREHAIVWKMGQSPHTPEIFVAPGNAGTALIAHNVAIAATDISALLRFVHENSVDFTFVGPETPLAEGIVDEFEAHGLSIFGPHKNAARIEASKVFSKELMLKHGIPCANSRSFNAYDEAASYVITQTAPIVIKADGLAMGKGVTVAQTIEEALNALRVAMQNKAFGEAGNQVVIEECLTGREMSFFVFTDGKTVQPMVPACDYKRVFDGGNGPNTGGMGSYSPPEFYNPALGTQVMQTVMDATIKAMRDEGCPYRGVLYGGLILTTEGPKVIEFNARFGDPETQVVLPRLASDLVDITQAVIARKLDEVPIVWHPDACVGVALTSGGYPEKYQTGYPISGLDELDKDVMVFHAGTKSGTNGEVLTAGGRVLTIVARGETLASAREKVYSNVSRIMFTDMHYRKDVALV